jgi:hypothetical protein
MTEQSRFQQELAGMLQERGYSEEDVKKVLDHVRQYEIETRTDSVMDSIAKGSFDIVAIVNAALGEPGPEQGPAKEQRSAPD